MNSSTAALQCYPIVDICRIIRFFFFQQPLTVEALTQSVCDLALGFGEGKSKGGKKKGSLSRPFGVALLVAGYDEKGPQLFFSDPSGTFLQYKAKSIGAGSEGAQSTLQEKYRAEMTLADAEDLALEILKQVMEEKVANNNVEVASVTQAVSTEFVDLCFSEESIIC